MDADDDDEPFDPVVEYRNFLTDMFGPEMAAVLAKGLPTLMNVDLSKRVGMGDIGTPLPFMRQGRTGTEAVNNTLVRLRALGRHDGLDARRHRVPCER